MCRRAVPGADAREGEVKEEGREGEGADRGALDQDLYCWHAWLSGRRMPRSGKRRTRMRLAAKGVAALYPSPS